MDKTTKSSYYLSMSTTVDMIFHEELQIIFEHIAKAFGFRMSVFSPDFIEQTPGPARPNCSYCRMIQENLNLIEACRRSDRDHCMKAGKTGEIQYYTCHAGLAEAIYPLFSKSKCIGYIIVGQFRSSSGIPEQIISASGGIENELREAYDKLGVHDPEQLKSILELVRITTRYIIENRILEQKNNIIAERIISFIDDNNDTNPKIEDAARHVKRSVSTVNKILREATGQSFKQYSISLRMEKGAELLRNSPDMNIQEISAAVGLDDQFYFSRLFKKKYGIPPRAYRNRHQQQ